MANFSNNWTNDLRPNTREKIKESIKSPQPLKPKVEYAKNKIQAQNQKLDVILEKLRGKEKTLFSQVISHLQKHDAQQAKMKSNELAQIRKTATTISQLKMGIEQVHLRLESTIDIGDVMGAIGPAMGALTRVRSGLSGVVPDVDLELGEINGVFGDIMMNAGDIANMSFAFDASGGEDVDRIVAEASAVAEQRMSESFPDVPIGSFGKNGSRSSIGEHSL
jgi:division protein CdvB (Snf7/Vps24/ESCRT-III family)